ncbi:MAG: hypothetical protein ACI399_06780 [Candidatus Cryptobacteroides sp.]
MGSTCNTDPYSTPLQGTFGAQVNFTALHLVVVNFKGLLTFVAQVNFTALHLVVLNGKSKVTIYKQVN